MEDDPRLLRGAVSRKHGPFFMPKRLRRFNEQYRDSAAERKPDCAVREVRLAVVLAAGRASGPAAGGLELPGDGVPLGCGEVREGVPGALEGRDGPALL